MKSLALFFLLALSYFTQDTLVDGATDEEIEVNSIYANKDLLVAAMRAGNETNLIKQFIYKLDHNEINIIYGLAITECAKNTTWFASLVQAELNLYDQHFNEGNIGKRNPISYATTLYKLRQNKRYYDLSETVKEDVRRMWNRMPESANLLFYDSPFCLKNRLYSHFLYTAIKPEGTGTTIDDRVWLWSDNRSVDGTSNFKLDIKNFYDNGFAFNVTIQGTYYPGMYLIMSQTYNRDVLGWDSLYPPKRHIWTMEYLDDERVIFYQEHLLMCAVRNIDGQRFEVAGSDKYSKGSAECQWLLWNCVF